MKTWIVVKIFSWTLAVIQVAGLTGGFMRPKSMVHHQSTLEGHNNSYNAKQNCASLAAAALIASVAAVVPQIAFADTAGADIRGTKLTPLNSLTFQYRGADFGGLDSSTINGPSISYKEFLDKLSGGDVEFVEFLAPNGDEAYATLKSTKSRIRIGEGFPIEQSDGWSSPAFAIRSVKEKGIPYKFVVPGLAQYN